MHHCIGWHVPGDGRTGTHQGILAHLEARQQCCISPNARTFMNNRSLVFLSIDLSPWYPIVREHRIWTHEYLGSDFYSLPQGDTIFYHGVVSNLDAMLNEAMLANIAVLPDASPLHHVRKRPNAASFTNVSRVHQRLGMDKEFCAF